ncbi:hypothetical protein [Pseudoalteromonas sp. R3]|uniref:hypothetical protein n=1 Tax=Pseudoalteromonas sp. R3 TaxID=1709477 RepID=UPI0006B5AF85|nr:hypothetical protein [Pseudoalteromonas sp. R3]AZZ98781.1 hypothetical protein ELR70_17745 [Pseudoalteromonas sp. R3]
MNYDPASTRKTLKEIRQAALEKANQLRDQAEAVLSEADDWCALELFGQTLADKHGYRGCTTGRDAITYYLSLKLSIRPAAINDFSLAELKLALSQEMADFEVPSNFKLAVG